VNVLAPEEQTTFHYTGVCAQPGKEATPVPGNALWIAARVVQHRLDLYTRDGQLRHLPQIPLMRSGTAEE